MWWLMAGADVNSVKTILVFLNNPHWREDLPRLVKGAIDRQQRGRWNTTTANAWGRIALKRFSESFEAVKITGASSVSIGKESKSLDWVQNPSGNIVTFDWPKGKETLLVAHEGMGKPWATIQAIAAIPRRESFSSGFKINKRYIPVEQSQPGRWKVGDVVRVRLEIESQADMTWVVINDPVPAGAGILGSGLGRDSKMLIDKEKKEGWVWPAFEERSYEAFRAYYHYVPKGKWFVEYTIRLNNSGVFRLPETRVEALYAPEMFGEIPNGSIEIQ